jgi:hypothetical protein
MIEEFFKRKYKIGRPPPVGNFDIWRIGKISGELEHQYGLDFAEKRKTERKSRFTNWYYSSAINRN